LPAVGFRVVRDSRINRFYATQGMLVDFAADFFSQGLGSKYSFRSYKFTFNKYWSMAEKQVLTPVTRDSFRLPRCALEWRSSERNSNV
jgi:outer membrane protein assembly factor BamA